MQDPTKPAELRSADTPRRTPAEVATRVAKRAAVIITGGFAAVASTARGQVLCALATQQLKDAPRPLRLCLGSGHAPIDGWVNIDFEPPADILVDLRFGLPVRNASVTSIYSEHLVEHFSLDAAMGLFRDWRRAIAPDGTVRIATPDLERLLASCTSGEDWRSEHEWLTWPAYAQIDTPVRMLNTAMREWGHLYLYDFTELAGRLREAGFTDVRRVRIGESEDPDLRLLETRADSHLVVEARP